MCGSEVVLDHALGWTGYGLMDGVGASSSTSQLKRRIAILGRATPCARNSHLREEVSPIGEMISFLSSFSLPVQAHSSFQTTHRRAHVQKCCEMSPQNVPFHTERLNSARLGLINIVRLCWP